MILKNIQFSNYSGLRDGQIDFDRHLTVISGKNGSGKTSLLKTVSIVVSWIIARIKSEKGNGTYIPADSITNGYQDAMIEAVFDEIGSVRIPNKAKSGLTKTYVLDLDGIKQYAGGIRQAIEATNFKCSIPIFAFYGVKRAVIDIPLRIRNKEEELLDTYNDCLNGAANFRDFFMWFRNQEDLENEMRVRPATAGDRFTRELDAFRNAMKIFLPDYTDIHIRRRPLRMVVKKQGTEVNVSQLSDGEKIYLALIGDLCRKLVLANPTMDDPLQGEGIVMIDEIDLHLHPKWQGEFATRLTTVFPNIQFIVTTHSPQVLNRVPATSVRALNDGKVNHVDYSYGLPSGIILKDIMDLEHEQPEEIEKALDAVYGALRDGDLHSAKSRYASIRSQVPYHPDLVRIQKIIDRAERGEK